MSISPVFFIQKPFTIHHSLFTIINAPYTFNVLLDGTEVPAPFGVLLHTLPFYPLPTTHYPLKKAGDF